MAVVSITRQASRPWRREPPNRPQTPHTHRATVAALAARRLRPALPLPSRSVSLSFYFLAAGALLGLWDAALGVRLNQAGKQPLPARIAFAWKERRASIIGGALIVFAMILQAFGE